MTTEGRRRDKIMEWGRRYLPLEIAGWVGELGGAAAAYLWTGSLAAAAIAATAGSAMGYYIPAYLNAVRWSIPKHRHQPWPARTCLVHLLAIRSLAVEFGPAEVIDSLALRPALIYALPVLLDHVVWGWLLGGFIADVAFYLCAIVSYERFKGLLAQREPHDVTEREDDREPTTTIAAA